MRALLDTNIIIHREAPRGVNQDIGMLFKWLDRAGYSKCIHPVSIAEIANHKDPVTTETLRIKLDSYEQLQTVAPMAPEVKAVAGAVDRTSNDRIDTVLLNEVYQGRVDILVTEDKKIRHKAATLQIADRVHSIESFLEKITAEFPALVDYKVLSVRQALFGNIDLNDPFFDSFKGDYPAFEKWFHRKSDEKAYITVNNDNGRLLSFLYLKREDKDEAYSDIEPLFRPKRRLKIGTFKVLSNGFRLGERFLRIIFDNALANRVDEIYVTIFERNDEQRRLIALLEDWGFTYWGSKKASEFVYTRDFSPRFDVLHPRLTYPYVSRDQRVFLVPIFPDYHTELFPDSILRPESPMDFIDSTPYRNAINKVYVSGSMERGVRRGDVLVFYRTGGYYKSVISTICLVEDVVLHFTGEDDFIRACRQRSVLSEQALRERWRKKPHYRPFIVSMLYVYSFPKRPNMQALIDNRIIDGIDDAPRGFRQISPEQFISILKITETNASFIID